MEGGKVGHTPAKDSAWSKFEEYARQRVVGGGGGGLPGSRNPLSPTSGRLHKEDMAIYGREPATDNMLLVVCELCGRVVKSQALLKHKELYHSEILKGPPPPKHPYHLTPVQTFGQPSVGIGAIVTGGNVKKSKECDFDRHCGVWMEPEKKYCRKSITCKIHSLELRQKVLGRSRPLSELLQEHKKLKKLKKMGKLRSLGQSVPPPTSPLIMSPASNLISASPGSAASPPPPSSNRGMFLGESPLPPSCMVYLDGVEEEHDLNNEFQEQSLLSTDDSVLSDEQLYPKPAVVNSYRCRQATQGYHVFSHHADTLRSSLVSLSGRDKEFYNVTESSLFRQFNHLFRQRHVQRKYSYLGKQNHILLSYPRHSTTLSFTPPSIQTSTNVTVDTPTLTTSQQPTTRFSTSQFYNSHQYTNEHHQAVYQPKETKRVNENPSPSLPKNRKRSRRSSKVHQPSVQNDKEPTLPISIPTSGYVNKRHMNEKAMTECNDEVEDWRHVRIKQEEFTLNHNEETLLHQRTASSHMKTTQSPLMNGVVNLSNSLSSPVQPFSVSSSPQTYVLNPSQHLLPRSILPVGGPGMAQSVTPATPQSYPGAPIPLSMPFLSDQLNAQMIQHLIVNQHQPPHVWIPPQNSSGVPELVSDAGSNSAVISDVNSTGEVMYANNSTDTILKGHLTNQIASPSQPHLTKYCLPSASPLTMQHMTAAGGLVQPSHLSPVPTDNSSLLPSSVNSSPSHPHLRRLAPSGGNQGTTAYHQPGLGAPQNVTQRTQQVS